MKLLKKNWIIVLTVILLCVAFLFFNQITATYFLILIAYIKCANSLINNYSNLFLLGVTAAYVVITLFILFENRKLLLSAYLPIIYISYDEATGYFVIKNIGKGLATRVEISKFHIFASDTKAGSII